MGVLQQSSWCFCNRICKSEKTKSAIFSGKAPSMARIGTGTAFLIHRNLLLTTHAILPSVAAAHAADIRLHNGARASLFPHRFFITSPILDLTIVWLDAIDADSNASSQQHSHYLKPCSKPNLDLGRMVYLLGYTEKNDLTIGEGKVVIATDNLIKVRPDGVTWSPGSAGFDVHGNLSFMVCDPMKLATSPTARSSSTSSSTSSGEKNSVTQFGIPIYIICDWLSQHWEGSLDDFVSKPKLPIIRLMATGQKSEHSCSSFTRRQVFKMTENENEDQPGPSSSQDETPPVDQRLTITEIYESPKLTSDPFRKTEKTQTHLLDINFPPRTTVGNKEVHSSSKEKSKSKSKSNPIAEAEIVSTGSVNGAHSEVQSCASPIELAHEQNGYSSDGQTTMYSAETAESRNYPSPKEGRFHQQQVGRSQSCVSYNRWGSGSVQRNPIARRGTYGYSQATTSQRSNDYYSPTVSSIMKNQNNSERLPSKRRSNASRSSPKWMF
ncbi:putative peptidase S1, PA clan [Helianthus annuus]|nr:putative peptidase S1, PA clan [Helianthus annuus]